MPTPPPCLRRMRLLHGWVRRYPMGNKAVAWPGADFSIPIPILSSTKSGFLCFFDLRNPRFRAFRAQNRGFCALLGSGTLVFCLFEHKIEVFVRFWGSEPSFSSISSTKSRFLCASYWGCWPGCGKIGLCERNTERWELKSRIGKGRSYPLGT